MRKLKRKPTNTDDARIKTLEDRLDAAVAESRRMRHELETLQRRDQLTHPTQPARTGQPGRRRPPTEMDTFNPDDTVN